MINSYLKENPRKQQQQETKIKNNKISKKKTCDIFTLNKGYDVPEERKR